MCNHKEVYFNDGEIEKIHCETCGDVLYFEVIKDLDFKHQKEKEFYSCNELLAALHHKIIFNATTQVVFGEEKR